MIRSYCISETSGNNDAEFCYVCTSASYNEDEETQAENHNAIDDGRPKQIGK